MKSLSIFLYEWKHFIRSPFKVLALLLFILAAAYGMHNGASLYHKQKAEIDKVNEKITEERLAYFAYFDEGKKGPEERPWIDLTNPFWAIWYNGLHHFKTPSPALVYSIGQAEQYGFYKRVAFNASTLDADMTKEIANPERLQTGTLDFSFALLYLLPLLLLVLLYNLKSAEAEQGFLSLIEVQTASKNAWLFSRILFYVSLLFVAIVLLLLVGGLLTNVFSSTRAVFGQMLMFSSLYLIFWSAIFYIILRSGKTIIGNTLKMVGIWLLFAFLVPAVVHQWVSIKKPANLMTEFIDATRDGRQALYDQPDSLIQAQLNTMFPTIINSVAAQDSTKITRVMNRSTSALVNELMKKSTASIETDNQEKNKIVNTSYWFNPITFFQNRFNQISDSHYEDYQEYRSQIQTLIDRQNENLVLDLWNDVKVNKEKYMEYTTPYDSTR